jgi:hypothetical protein
LRFGIGVDDVPMLMEIAKSVGLLKGGGGWFEYTMQNGESVREHGEKSVLKRLREKPEFAKDLVEVLTARANKEGMESAFGSADGGQDEVVDL